MDWLFEGLVKWISSTIASLFDGISKVFENALGCDLSEFDKIFKFAITAENIMLGIGLSLLFLIMIFQLFRSLWGPLADKSVEHPVAVVLRSIVFFPIVFFSKSIVIYILTLVNVPYQMMVHAYANSPNTSWASSINNGMGGWLTAGTIAMSGSAILLLGLIFIILIGWNYIKLVIEVAERYVILGILAYTAPLAVATGGSKATSGIFQNWCKFMASQVLMMVMNVWCLSLIDSGMGSLGSNVGHLSDFVLWALVIIAMEKAAQSIDNYIKSIIGNGAITGNGILDDIVATAGTLKASASGIAGLFGSGGKTGGGSGGGGNPKAPPSASKGNVFSQAQGFTKSDYVKAGWKAGAVGVAGMAAVQGIKTGAHKVAEGWNALDLDDCLKSGRTSSTLNANIAKAAHGNGAKYGGFINDATSKTPIASKAANYYVGGGTSNFHDTTIGDGKISAHSTDTNGNGSTVKYFAATHYRAPDADTYTPVTAKDGSSWYKQQWADGETAPKAPERL